MKLRNFLKLSSLLILTLGSEAKFEKDDVYVEWNSARLQFLDGNIHVFNKGPETPSFLTVDIKEKSINLNKDNINLDLMIDDIRNLSGLEVRFMEERNSNNYLAYTLPLFTDYEFNLLQSSVKTKIGISGSNLVTKGKKPTKLNFATFYFAAKAAETRLSLWSIEKTKKKSAGVLTLTFDDGPDDNLVAARILKEYNIPATAYIMPNSLNTEGFLTKKELIHLSKQNWDIDSHHEIPFTQFSNSELHREVKSVHDFLKDNKYKSSNFHLAYPLGKTNENATTVVKEKFATARLASGGIETIPPANLHKLRAFNVLKTTTPSELKAVIESTKKNKQWLILMFHHIRDKAIDDIDYSRENFKELAKIISKSDIEILTINQVWEKYLK